MSEERRIAVTLLVFEDMEGEARFALDYFSADGKGYTLSWVRSQPCTGAELEIFADAVADAYERARTSALFNER